MQNAAVNVVYLKCGEHIHKVIGNGFVDAKNFLPFDPMECGILEMVHYPTLKQIIDHVPAEDLKRAVSENASLLVPKHILIDDIVASISYLLGLPMAADRRYRPPWQQAPSQRWRTASKPSAHRYVPFERSARAYGVQDPNEVPWGFD